MYIRTYVVLALLLCPAAALAQRVSFGFIGGTNLTRDFPISRTIYQDDAYPTGLTTFDLYSDSKSFIAGPTIEFSLSKQLALEADALHRNLYLKNRIAFPDGQKRNNDTDSIGTWEWPILLKYRFAMGQRRPFLEAGPSFRTRKNPGQSEPSQFGATAGAGLEFRLGPIRLAPMLRYTRWQYDGNYPRFATKRDQLELLTAISYSPSVSSICVRGKKIHAGLIAGTPLTSGFDSVTGPVESQGYMAGLLAELEWNQRISIEVNGIYRPLRAPKVPDRPDGRFGQDEFTVLTWQLPVLVKYRMAPLFRIRPTIEGGPSFRFSGNRNGYDPSRAGATAGVGGEFHYRAMKVGPMLRYTRWAGDDDPFKNQPRSIHPPRTNPNQVEVVVTFSF